MRKSTTWQSIVSALAIILAVLVILNIQHPDWVKNLLVWQPEAEREIAWRYGVDLGNTHRITLTTESEPNATEMQAAFDIIKSRARSLAVTDPVVELSGNHIFVQAPGSQNLAVLTQTLQAPGLIEFIAAGTEGPQSRIVETTLDRQPDIESISLTPTEEEPIVYETVMTNADLEYITLQLLQSSYSKYAAKFKFTPSGNKALLDYNQSHPGELLCITLDKLILTCSYSSDIMALMERDAGGNVNHPIAVQDAEEPAISAVLNSGYLPVRLQVDGIESTEPTLGKETINRVGIAAIIALSVALVFLLVHYRLLGLLTALALVVFTLLSLALYKILPIPITLVTITGLVTTGLATMGALLSVAERLRRRALTAQALPRAVEAAFSNAWPSIRSTHLAFGLLAATIWIVAAIVTTQTINWLGISLIIGTLASLFSTMIFSRALVNLIASIDAIQRLLDERKWLMGI
jgi:preprotein translocase subunit SecD